jgi:hypothetical protein
MAAKSIHLEDKSVAGDIQKEVDILKKCHHPNIVNYFGCVTGKPKQENAKFQYPSDSKGSDLWVQNIRFGFFFSSSKEVLMSLSPTDFDGLLCSWIHQRPHSKSEANLFLFLFFSLLIFCSFFFFFVVLFFDRNGKEPHRRSNWMRSRWGAQGTPLSSSKENYSQRHQSKIEKKKFFPFLFLSHRTNVGSEHSHDSTRRSENCRLWGFLRAGEQNQSKDAHWNVIPLFFFFLSLFAFPSPTDGLSLSFFCSPYWMAPGLFACLFFFFSSFLINFCICLFLVK